MGKLIPAGTGIPYYQDVRVNMDIEELPTETFEEFMEANDIVESEDVEVDVVDDAAFEGADEMLEEVAIEE